jgi:hypothetical protein
VIKNKNYRYPFFLLFVVAGASLKSQKDKLISDPDPGSGKNLSRIQGVKNYRIRDPDTQFMQYLLRKDNNCH